MQLDGELRQIKEALRLVEVFLSFEDAAPTEDEEPVRDKFLTLVLQDKKSTFSRLLTGLVECVQAISACVNKGKLDKFSGNGCFPVFFIFLFSTAFAYFAECFGVTMITPIDGIW